MRQRRRWESFIQSVLDSESHISPVLLEEACQYLDHDETEQYQPRYAQETHNFNIQQSGLARILIADLAPGLKHHSIHCLSFRECMSTVIGLDMDQFSRLFASIRVFMAERWPRSPETLEPGETSNYGERRLRLFLCLYRLKQGCTFQHMEVTFGWCSSILQEWFDGVLHILNEHLFNFHEGFLAYKGAHWQMRELIKWNHKHQMDGMIGEYQEKVCFQNAESRRHGGIDTIDATAFVGSIGAVDGTYCVQPAIGRATLLAHGSDPLQDIMWSEYKRCHAYKLLLVHSHGLEGEPKYLLWVAHANGSSSDGAVYSTFAADLRNKLCPGAVLLGDHAFHGAQGVIAPFTAAQVVSALGADRATFNKNHSSDRMTSEHGVRALKLWGIARGREDSSIFQNDDNFATALKVVWALHNYKACGCPVVF